MFAIEASDIVLIDDDPYKIVKAIKIAKQTRTIAMQNIVLSLTVKILVIILGALGLSSMWTAILSDVGISLIVILNSVRILKMKYNNKRLSITDSLLLYVLSHMFQSCFL